MNESEILQLSRHLAQPFNELHAVYPQSPTLRHIYRETWKEEYPEELNPINRLTWTDLRNIRRSLQIGVGQTFLDIACGQGGIGLWIAHETGASLVGFDLSPVAIAAATERAHALNLGHRARFAIADALATGWDSAQFDGAICVDSFANFVNKAMAAAEIARLLRPHARFVFTADDYTAPPQLGKFGSLVPQLSDHRRLLEKADFVVLSYEAISTHKSFHQILYQKMLACQDTLFAEMGQTMGKNLITQVQKELENSHLLQRSLVVAQKRAIHND